MLSIGGIQTGAGIVIELPPADAAIAAQWLGVDTVIPGHYVPDSPAVAQLTADLSAIAPGVEVVRLEVNEQWTAPARLHHDLPPSAAQIEQGERA